MNNFKKFTKIKKLRRGSSKESDNVSIGSASGDGSLSKQELKDLPQLHRAIWENDVKSFEKHYRKDLNLLDKQKRSPMHLACIKGNAEFVERLLEMKADTKIGDEDMFTPLTRAIKGGHLSCVNLLLQFKADPLALDSQNRSCLYYAAACDNIQVLEMVLSKTMPLLDSQDKFGMTPLHAAVSCRNIEAVKLLLQHGANYNAVDTNQTTPLMLAAGVNDRPICQCFLEKNTPADASLKDSLGLTAADIARNKGYTTLADFISDHIECQPTNYDSLFSAGDNENNIKKHGNGKNRPLKRQSATDFDDDDDDKHSWDSSDSDEYNTSTSHPISSERESDGLLKNRPRTASEDEGDDSHKEADNPQPDVGLKPGPMPGQKGIESMDRESRSKIPKLSSNKNVTGQAKPVQELTSDGTEIEIATDKKHLNTIQDLNKPKIAQPMIGLPISNVSPLEADDENSDMEEHRQRPGGSLPEDSAYPAPLTSLPSVDVVEHLSSKDSASEKINDNDSILGSDADVSLPICTPRGDDKSEDQLRDQSSDAMQTVAEVVDDLLRPGDTPDGINAKRTSLQHDSSPVLSSNHSGESNKVSQEENTDSKWDDDEDDADDDLGDHLNENHDTTLTQQNPNPELKKKSFPDDLSSSMSLPTSSSGGESPTTTRPALPSSSAVSPTLAVVSVQDTSSSSHQTPSFSRAPQSIENSQQEEPYEHLPSPLVSTNPKIVKPNPASEVDIKSSDAESPPMLGAPQNRALPSLPNSILLSESAESIGTKTSNGVTESNQQSSHVRFEDNPSVLSLESKPSGTKKKLNGASSQNVPILDNSAALPSADNKSTLGKSVRPIPIGINSQHSDSPTSSSAPPVLPRKFPPVVSQIGNVSGVEHGYVNNFEIRKHRIEQKFRSQDSQDYVSHSSAISLNPPSTISDPLLKNVNSPTPGSIQPSKAVAAIFGDSVTKNKPKQLPSAAVTPKPSNVKSDVSPTEPFTVSIVKSAEIEPTAKSEDTPQVPADSAHFLPKKPSSQSVPADDSETPANVLESPDSNTTAVQLAELKKRREEAERELEHTRKINLGEVDLNDSDSSSENDAAEDGEGDLTPRLNRKPVLESTRDLQDDVNLSYSDTENEISQSDILPPTSLPKLGRLPTWEQSSALCDDASFSKMNTELKEIQKSMDREVAEKLDLQTKLKMSEQEVVDLKRRLEVINREKQKAEKEKFELETQTRDLQFRLNQETDKRRSSESLLEKTRGHVVKKEEQLSQEMEERTKNLALIHQLQMQLKSSKENHKQLEQDNDDLLKRLEEKRQTIAHQLRMENAESLTAHVDLSASNDADENSQNADETKPEVEEENDDKSGEEPSTINKYLLDRLARSENHQVQSMKQELEKLTTELYASKLELERQNTKSQEERSELSAERDELKMKLHDTQAESKLNEDALHQATIQYNLELGNRKTDVDSLSKQLDRERHSKDTYEHEVQELRTRINAATLELEKARMERLEAERLLDLERETLKRLRHDNESVIDGLKDSNQTLTRRLNSSESRMHSLENQLHVANTTLSERQSFYSSIQQEADSANKLLSEANANLYKEKGESAQIFSSDTVLQDHNMKLQAKVEALQERVSTLQTESGALRQQLRDAQAAVLQQAASTSGSVSADVVASFKADFEKGRALMEERVVTLQNNVTRLEAELRTSELRRVELEKQAQDALHGSNETGRRVAAIEASLQSAKEARDSAERERFNLQVKLDSLKEKCDRLESERNELEHRCRDFSSRLDHAERSSIQASQQLANQHATADSAHRNKEEMENFLQKLRLEKQQLEGELRMQEKSTDNLKADLRNVSQAKHDLEEEVIVLRDDKYRLEEKLKEEINLRDSIERDADQSRNLLEDELRTKTKFGQKISQMEKQKLEAIAKLAEEKLKSKRASESKESLEERLSAELNRSEGLARDLANSKAQLKGAKRKLKELGYSDAKINELHTEFDKERSSFEDIITSLKRQVGDLSHELTQSTAQKDSLQTQNKLLEQQLAQLKNVETDLRKIERERSDLSNELHSVKVRVSTSYVEKTELSLLQRQLEDQYRARLSEKVDQLNSFLADQVKEQQKVEDLREKNERQLKADLESSRQRYEAEVAKLRHSIQESLAESESSKMETKRLQQLYDSEVKLRNELNDKLSRAGDKEMLARTQLQLSNQRSNMISSVGSPLLRSSPVLPSTVTSSPSRISDEALLVRIRRELDKSIAKHVDQGSVFNQTQNYL